ncbi:MAG TPA: DUF4944 domain-containing protein [Bacillaceae bacterium]
MKQFLFGLAFAAGVGLIVYILLGIQPKWVGSSPDGKWEAVLHVGTDSNIKNRYFGELRWKGTHDEMEQCYITYLQYRQNGEYAAGDVQGGSVVMPVKEVQSFVDFSSKPSKSDKLEVIIHWAEKEKIHKQTIELYQK